MPPRSMVDRDEHSLRRECSFDSSNASEFKQAQKDMMEEQPPPSVDDQRPQQQEQEQEPEPPQAPPKKSVSFAPTAKVRQITKLNKDQAKDVWFNNEDFAQMKKSFAPTVQRMMNGTLTKDLEQTEDFCTRGLEYRTKDGAKKRMKNKFNGMAAVLHEQDRQTFEEQPDAELLARVYREANFHCVAEAMALGEQDAIDIQDYISTDNEPFYDAVPSCSAAAAAPGAPQGSPLMMSSPKRGGGIKLSPKGSFHERGIRTIKRVFSGSSKMLRRNNAVTAVPVQ